MSPLLRRSLWTLAAANVALAAVALRTEDLRVTTGPAVALGIAVTSLVALGVSVSPLPAVGVARVQAFALATQVAHATGHLFGLYEEWPRYDDVLHGVAFFVLGAVMLGLARDGRFLFDAAGGPARTATLIALVTVALAALWEVYEFATDFLLRSREQDDLVDTMLDIVDGVAGAVLAALLSFRVLRRDVATGRAVARSST